MNFIKITEILKQKYKNQLKRMLLNNLQNSKRFLSSYDDFKKVLERLNNKQRKLTRNQELYLFGVQGTSAFVPILLFLSISILSVILLSGSTNIIMIVMLIVSILIFYKNIDYAKLILNDIHHKVIDLRNRKQKPHLGFRKIEISKGMLEKILADEIKSLEK